MKRSGQIASLGDILDDTQPGDPARRVGRTKQGAARQTAPAPITTQADLEKLVKASKKGTTKESRLHAGWVKGRDVKDDKVVYLEKTHPVQLELFRTFLPDDEHVDDYSNLLELYDLIPKYSSAQQMKLLRKEVEGEKRFLEKLKRSFRHRGKTYHVTVTPARIEDPDGVERMYYPTGAEELLEEAAKRLALDPLCGVYLNGSPGVQCTLRQLQDELASHGHSTNWYDLQRSILICRHCNVELTDSDGKTYLDEPIFPIVSMPKRKKWLKDAKNTCCYLQFNFMAAYRINKADYHQYDSASCMRYKSHLARWMVKRMSMNYTQAAPDTPYSITYNTIKRDSGLVNCERESDNRAHVDKAFDELKESKKENNVVYAPTLEDYKKSETLGARNKILDIHYDLYPHYDFVKKMKKANARQQRLISEAHGHGLIQGHDLSDRYYR